MAKIYIIFADGLEEIEALTPTDLLRRAGDDVVTVSIMGRKKIRGSHDIYIAADELFEDVDFSDADLVILPGGGGGTQNIAHHAGTLEVLKSQMASGKRIAAICAAPSVFGKLGFLRGRQAVVYPGMENTLEGAEVLDVPAVTDGPVTTGHGPGAAMEFSLELVRVLHGEDAREKLREQLVFQH